jgi:spermidine/putrescine-binding protein
VENAVYEFMNWMLSGYYGAKIAEKSGYVSATPNALDYLDGNEDEFDDPDFIRQRYETVLDPDEGKMNADGVWYNQSPTHKDKYETEWQRFLNA